MKLAELKEQNKAEDDQDLDADQIQDDVDLEEEDQADDDAADDEDQEQDDDKVVEPWQETDDQTSEDVPVGALMSVKRKLKGRISERDDEIASLKAKIEEMQSKPAGQQLPKRPQEDDFDTDEAYQKAVSEYEDQLVVQRFDRIEAEKTRKDTITQAQEALQKSVDTHYERAEKLITDSGISPDVYKQADVTVRQAIEGLIPKQGDLITDNLIKTVGEGSEKVMFFIGRNKAALLELKTLLSNDPSGLSAAVYLGQQKERLNNPKRKTSQTPKPASKANGDVQPGKKGRAFKKKYDAAHAGNKAQIAYNVKKEAKAAGVDVSSW